MTGILNITLALLTVACASAQRVAQSGAPGVLVIAHRGASGYRPEHTLEAYQLAIDQGADFIEPDLVATQDGVLIARHENEISETTDVATKFPRRKTTKVIEGRSVTGWFTEDFTLAEIRMLRAKERLPFRDHQYDGLFVVPTLGEILQLVREQSARKGRVIGIYPETKHPSYFRSIGLPLEESLLNVLDTFGHRDKTAPVFIQSFEVANLKMLRTKTTIRLVQLMDTDWEGALLNRPGVWREIKAYADGVGPNKKLLFDARLKVVEKAHLHRLVVHSWTFRREPQFLHPGLVDLAAEIKAALTLGVDGMFTDFPDAARAVTGP